MTLFMFFVFGVWSPSNQDVLPVMFQNSSVHDSSLVPPQGYLNNLSSTLLRYAYYKNIPLDGGYCSPATNTMFLIAKLKVAISISIA